MTLWLCCWLLSSVRVVRGSGCVVGYCKMYVTWFWLCRWLLSDVRVVAVFLVTSAVRDVALVALLVTVFCT